MNLHSTGLHTKLMNVFITIDQEVSENGSHGEFWLRGVPPFNLPTTLMKKCHKQFWYVQTTITVTLTISHQVLMNAKCQHSAAFSRDQRSHLARPKSPTFTSCLSLTRQLRAARSRWMKFCDSRNIIALQI